VIIKTYTYKLTKYDGENELAFVSSIVLQGSPALPRHDQIVCDVRLRSLPVFVLKSQLTILPGVSAGKFQRQPLEELRPQRIQSLPCLSLLWRVRQAT
jgi:hypothetical protein